MKFFRKWITIGFSSISLILFVVLVCKKLRIDFFGFNHLLYFKIFLFFLAITMLISLEVFLQNWLIKLTHFIKQKFNLNKQFNLFQKEFLSLFSNCSALILIPLIMSCFVNCLDLVHLGLGFRISWIIPIVLLIIFLFLFIFSQWKIFFMLYYQIKEKLDWEKFRIILISFSTVLLIIFLLLSTLSHVNFRPFTVIKKNNHDLSFERVKTNQYSVTLKSLENNLSVIKIPLDTYDNSELTGRLRVIEKNSGQRLRSMSQKVILEDESQYFLFAFTPIENSKNVFYEFNLLLEDQFKNQEEGSFINLEEVTTIYQFNKQDLFDHKKYLSNISFIVNKVINVFQSREGTLFPELLILIIVAFYIVGINRFLTKKDLFLFSLIVTSVISLFNQLYFFLNGNLLFNFTNLQLACYLIFLFLNIFLLFSKNQYTEIKLFFKKDFNIDLFPQFSNTIQVGLLSLILFIGVFLRVYQLGRYSPSKDEYAHLAAAQRLKNEGLFNYQRGKEMTLLVSQVFSWLETEDLFAARMVPVFFGSATILLVYFLGKKINKNIGLLATFLFSLSPLAIGMSRYIREYPIYTFIINLFSLYLFFWINILLNKGKNILKIIGFFPVLAVIYYSFIRWVGLQFRLIFPISILLAAPLLFPFIKKIFLSYPKKRILAIFAGVILVTIPVFNRLSPGFSINSLSLGYFNFFFNPLVEVGSAMQLFFGSLYHPVLLFLIFLLPLLKLRRENNYLKSYYLVFMLMMFLLSTFIKSVNRDFSPRFIYAIYPFFTIIFAVSIETIINLLKRCLNINNFIIGMFLFSIINPLNALASVVHEDYEVDIKTGLWHPDAQSVMQVLHDNDYDENDFVITSLGGLFSYYYDVTYVGNPDLFPDRIFDRRAGRLEHDYMVSVVGYDYNHKQNHFQTGFLGVIDAINKHKHGWLVLNQNKPVGELLEVKHDLEMVSLIKSDYHDKGFIIIRW